MGNFTATKELFLTIQFYMHLSLPIFAPKFKHGRFSSPNGKKYKGIDTKFGGGNL